MNNTALAPKVTARILKAITDINTENRREPAKFNFRGRVLKIGPGGNDNIPSQPKLKKEIM